MNTWWCRQINLEPTIRAATLTNKALRSSGQTSTRFQTWKNMESSSSRRSWGQPKALNWNRSSLLIIIKLKNQISASRGTRSPKTLVTTPSFEATSPPNSRLRPCNFARTQWSSSTRCIQGPTTGPPRKWSLRTNSRESGSTLKTRRIKTTNTLSNQTLISIVSRAKVWPSRHHLISRTTMLTKQRLIAVFNGDSHSSSVSTNRGTIVCLQKIYFKELFRQVTKPNKISTSSAFRIPTQTCKNYRIK